MMDKWKRFLGTVLALTALLSLAACGKPAENTALQDKSAPAEVSSTEEPAAEYAYTASFRDVDLGECSSVQYLNPSFYTDEAIFTIGSERVRKDIPEGAVEEYEGQYDVYEQRMVRITYDGKAEKVPYIPMSIEKDREGKYEYVANVYSQGVQMLPDGRLAEIAVFFDNWCTVEGIGRDDEEFWNHYGYSQEYYFRVLNPDGSEERKTLLPISEDSYVNAFSQDGKGNFVCSYGTMLIGISPEAEILWTIDTNEYVEGITLLGDGTLCVNIWGSSGLVLCKVDTEEGALGESMEVPSEAYRLCSGGGNYPVYYSSGTSFFGFDPETGEKEKLFSWLNTDVAADMYNPVRVEDDGTVVGLLNNSTVVSDKLISEYQIFEVRYTQIDPAAKKQTITLATQWLAQEVSREVLNFNRKNDKVHIDIVDYSQYNTEEDYTAGLTKLQTEMIAGNMPDIVDLSGMAVNRLDARGLLEDLYPYIDADEELSREDFFPNVLQSVEQNGKLVSTVPGFMVMSLLGDSSVVGDEPGWTYSEFEAALADMPEGCRAMSAYTTQDEILRACLGLDMGSFVNWSTGECNFNSEEFISLLEFAKRFPATYDWDDYNYETDSDMVGIATGQQMLVTAGITSMDDILYNQTYFGGKPYTYIGYPTSSGTGNYFYVNAGLAMTTACRNKEAVWEFLRVFFTEDYQKSLYALPARVSAYEAKLAEAMTVSYVKNEEGGYQLDKDGNRIPIVRATIGEGTDQIQLYALAQEDADKLTEVIRTTTRTLQTDESITDIVKEQAEAFFQGQKTAEEVARLTQSKVNIYVNEQR